MCRQIIFNKKGMDLIEKQYGGIEYFLRWLIVERGGNGNGIALFKDGKIKEFHKGLHTPTIPEIVKTLLEEDYDYGLFHTRLASIGSLSDQNCHPYVFSNDFAFAMNGTEANYVSKKKNLDTGCTDTYIIGKDLFESKMHPKDFLVRDDFRSMFFGFYKGTPYVAANNNRSIRVLTTGNINSIKETDPIVASSDFPLSYMYDEKGNVKPNCENIYVFDEKKFYFELGNTLPANIMKPAVQLNPYKEFIRQLDLIVDTAMTIAAQKFELSEDFITAHCSVDEVRIIAATEDEAKIAEMKKNFLSKIVSNKLNLNIDFVKDNFKIDEMVQIATSKDKNEINRIELRVITKLVANKLHLSEEIIMKYLTLEKMIKVATSDNQEKTNSKKYVLKK